MLEVEGKIPYFHKDVRKFVKYLNSKYPLKPQIKLHLYRYDSLTPELLEELGIEEESVVKFDEIYGIYDYETGDVHIATGSFWPKHLSGLLLIIAHEFCHILQDINWRTSRKKLRFSESKANIFCIDHVLKFIARECDDGY